MVFDCSGELTSVVQIESGPRATGHVELDIDLPDGSTWRSSGVVVINVPRSVQEQNVVGKKINRCIGEAEMSAERVDTINGVDIWSIQLTPIQIRLRAGNKRIARSDLGPCDAGVSSPLEAPIKCKGYTEAQIIGA